MDSTFTGEFPTITNPVSYIPTPTQGWPDPIGDEEWVEEIEALERAVDVLLELKRTVLRENPRRESALWYRHVERLRAIKRKVDAICV